MKKLNKTKFTSAIGVAALVTALGAPVNAAVVLGGNNGWEVSYGGFVNLFYTQSDMDFITATGTAQEDSAHLQEGLLPAFHTLTAKSPEINGLKGTAQITFAPDSSGPKATRLNKPGLLGDSTIDTREVFFTVEGDFGTILLGRTLALFQRQAILKDYTLFGVGALAGPDGGGTALGRIGFGYVYPDFRTSIRYKTPVINGLQVEVGVFDPQEPFAPAGNGVVETDTPQFQAEATYNYGFEGGNINLWLGGLWQEEDITAAGATTSDTSTSFGFNAGIDINYMGFNVMGSYYTGEALGTNLFNTGGSGDAGCVVVGTATTCSEADNDGFIIQGAYTFNGKTKLGITYGESNEDGETALGTMDTTNQLWTVGVYHDVNPWLKVVAEYSDYRANAGLSGALAGGRLDGQTFSIGGFLLW